MQLRDMGCKGVWEELGESVRRVKSKHTDYIYEVLQEIYLGGEKKNTKSIKLWSLLSLLSWLCGADFTGFYVMVVLKLMMLFPALDKNRHSTVSRSSFCIPVAQTAGHLSFLSLKVRVSFQRYN